VDNKTNEVVLTATEILAIENLNEVTIDDFILPMPPEKRDLVMKLYGIHSSLRVFKTVAQEKMDVIKKYQKIMRDNDIAL